MDYSSKITSDVSSTISATGFQLLWLPFKSAAKENRTTVLDVDLYNLKRAYDVPLDTHREVDFCKPNNCEEDEEHDWTDEHHPLEFCESQITEEEDDVSSLQSSDHEYKCCYCYFEGTVLHLRNHIKFCHPNEQNKSNWCHHCRLNFENEIIFKIHQKQEHDFYCLQCKKSFKRRRLLLAHLPIHSEEKSFKCPTCGKVFHAQRYFVRHLERHDKKLEVKEELEEQEYKCNVCQKVFMKKESLVKHSRIHTRESLKCSLCDFTCGKKVTLKMHFISHEGTRKYKCSHCDFSFKQIGHLKRHIARFNH